MLVRKSSLFDANVQLVHDYHGCNIAVIDREHISTVWSLCLSEPRSRISRSKSSELETAVAGHKLVSFLRCLRVQSRVTFTETCNVPARGENMFCSRKRFSRFSFVQ